MADTAHQTIDTLVKKQRVVLFMKGNRRQPQCGFSATVVQLLDGLLDDYQTVNVLEDPAIREGVKKYSNWPTVPQLYIGGEFVGGCDIVKDMYASGELQKLLGVNAAHVEAPKVEITSAAAKELKAAMQQAEEGDKIGLSIDAGFQHALNLGPPGPNDVEVKAQGISIFLDPASARRAAGVRIDFVTEGQEAGFQIDNPNAPPKVIEITPKDLQAKLGSGEIKEFYDVRTDEERAISKIDAAKAFTDATGTYLEALPKNTPIAFHCAKGGRSRRAAEHFRSLGFTRVYNLAGGISAWESDLKK